MELTRRKFLQTAVLGATAAAAGISLANLGLGPFSLKKAEAAQVSPQWDLQVTDATGNTVILTYEKLLAMPVTTVTSDLDCDDNLVTAGNWSGVSLGDLLQQAGLDPAAAYVNFKARDGYAVTIPMSTALGPYVIIAYELDGSPLPEVLRLVLPGAGGDLWISVITSMTLSNTLASANQSGSTPTNSTAPTSTLQQEPVQPQSQSAKPDIEAGTEPTAIPADVTRTEQKASMTRESGPDGSRSPVVAACGIALGATAALMAAGYVARSGHKSERAAESPQSP
jgi:DMSO/TMAO reductase YedYZ molybdopterin-dependent catalytic subunit